MKVLGEKDVSSGRKMRVNVAIAVATPNRSSIAKTREAPLFSQRKLKKPSDAPIFNAVLPRRSIGIHLLATTRGFPQPLQV
jgi:hypothetical protein